MHPVFVASTASQRQAALLADAARAGQAREAHAAASSRRPARHRPIFVARVSVARAGLAGRLARLSQRLPRQTCNTESASAGP